MVVIYSSPPSYPDFLQAPSPFSILLIDTNLVLNFGPQIDGTWFDTCGTRLGQTLRNSCSAFFIWHYR